MSETAVILTHGDVDGMTCAAQLIRREQGECRIVYSNATWIARALQRVFESLPSRVYITDIPCNERAADVAEQMAAQGIGVHWIDHHGWSGELLDRMKRSCARVIHNEAINTPAGVLLGAWLKHEDAYCEQIGGICYASEKGTDWERDWFRLLSSYVGRSDRAVLDGLAHGSEFSADDLQRIEGQRNLETQGEDILAVQPRTVTTHSGRRLAVYDTSATPGLYLGGKVFRHHPVDYCLVRIAAHKWQLASSPGSGLRLDGLVGSHDLDGLHIRAAGRPDRLLSVTTGRSDIPSDAHHRITDWATNAL
jgi:hypothetical protein